MIPCVLTDVSATTPITLLVPDSMLQQTYASGVVPLDGEWHIGAVTNVFRAAEVLPDWDSYGSPPPTTQARTVSLDLLRYIVGKGFDCSLPVPYAFPVAGGGIRLEWEKGQREVAFEVLPNGTTEFFRVQDGQPQEEGGLAQGRILAILDWLDEAA